MTPTQPHRARPVRLVGIVLSAIALLALSACGSGGSTPTSGSVTRTVQTVMGPVKVPSNPLRVVAIQPSATNGLFDVGVTPVGIYDEGAQYESPRYLAKYNAIAKVGDNGTIDVERIAALHPDLIIGVNYDWNTSVYKQLSAIAPTVIAGVQTWQQTAQQVAAAVNRTSQLNALEQQVKTEAAAIKTQYASVLSKYRWDILQGSFDKGQFWLYGPQSDAGTILASAGVQFAPSSEAITGNANKTLSYEQINTLSDADVIGFYANFDDTPNNEAPALFAQPGFKLLPASKNDRLVPLPDFLPGGYGDALALLDEVKAGLQKLAAS